MNFGLIFPNFGAYSDVRLTADLAVTAEAAGWDGVFVTDTIQMAGYEAYPAADPWLMLAAIALRTSRVKLGPRVAAPTRRRPWQLAREAVTLDHLSKGRLILGVGLGDEHDQGFAAFHETVAPRDRATLLDETLAIMTGLWSGERFQYTGTHYQVEPITLLPRPVQTPRIPIWVGWRYPNRTPLRRVARWDGGTPFLINPDGSYGELTPAANRELHAYFVANRPGGAPFDLVTDAPLLDVNDDPAALTLLRDHAAAGVTWALHFIDPDQAAGPLRDRIAAGPPVLAREGAVAAPH